MQQTDILLTYDDYLTLPNDGKRYEIIEGELNVSPAPEFRQQEIIGNIYAALGDFVRSHSLGKVSFAPVDVVLSMTDIVQPDIVYVSTERLAFIKKKNIAAAPDLVVEVLSPSTAIMDRTRKKSLYEKYGVREYWIVDIEAGTVEVYPLSRQTTPGQRAHYGVPSVFRKDDSVVSPLLTGFVLPVSSVFED